MLLPILLCSAWAGDVRRFNSLPVLPSVDGVQDASFLPNRRRVARSNTRGAERTLNQRLNQRGLHETLLSPSPDASASPDAVADWQPNVGQIVILRDGCGKGCITALRSVPSTGQLQVKVQTATGEDWFDKEDLRPLKGLHHHIRNVHKFVDQDLLGVIATMALARPNPVQDGSQGQRMAYFAHEVSMDPLRRESNPGTNEGYEYEYAPMNSTNYFHLKPQEFGVWTKKEEVACSTTVILAFRGTNNKADLLADVDIALGRQNESDRFLSALRTTKHVMAWAREMYGDDYQIRLVGHSLGASLALWVTEKLRSENTLQHPRQAPSFRNHLDTHAFNPGSCSVRGRQHLGTTYGVQNPKNHYYFVQWDILCASLLPLVSENASGRYWVMPGIPLGTMPEIKNFDDQLKNFSGLVNSPNHRLDNYFPKHHEARTHWEQYKERFHQRNEGGGKAIRAVQNIMDAVLDGANAVDNPAGKDPVHRGAEILDAVLKGRDAIKAIQEEAAPTKDEDAASGPTWRGYTAHDLWMWEAHQNGRNVVQRQAEQGFGFGDLWDRFRSWWTNGWSLAYWNEFVAEHADVDGCCHDEGCIICKSKFPKGVEGRMHGWAAPPTAVTTPSNSGSSEPSLPSRSELSWSRSRCQKRSCKVQSHSTKRCGRKLSRKPHGVSRKRIHYRSALVSVEC